MYHFKMNYRSLKCNEINKKHKKEPQMQCLEFIKTWIHFSGRPFYTFSYINCEHQFDIVTHHRVQSPKLL